MSTTATTSSTLSSHLLPLPPPPPLRPLTHTHTRTHTHTHTRTHTHTDRHASAEPEEREKEEGLFKEVSEAYQVLSDERKRSRYDSGQDLEDMQGMDVDASSLFTQMFGGGFGGMHGFGGGFGGGRRSQTFTFAGPGEYSFAF